MDLSTHTANGYTKRPDRIYFDSLDPSNIPSGTWPTNTAPTSLHPSLLPPEYRTPLSSQYSLAPGTSNLSQEYAYRNLYRHFYGDNINLPNATSAITARPDTLLTAPNFAVNTDPYRGLEYYNTLSRSYMSGLNGGLLGVKAEFDEHNGEVSSSFRVPQPRSHDHLPIGAVKTEIDSRMTNRVPSELDSPYQDMGPGSVQIDVVGIDGNSPETREFSINAADTERTENTSEKKESDSGLASDLGNSASHAHQGSLSRSDVITPPSGSDDSHGKPHTPEGNPTDSGCFVTPVQPPHGKDLFPDPVGASTPMDDDSLWRPWNKAAKNTKKFHCSEQIATSNLEISQAIPEKHISPSNSTGYSTEKIYPKSSKSLTSVLPQEREACFISPVLPLLSGRQRVQNIRESHSPKSKSQTFTHPFSIEAMLKQDNVTKGRISHPHQHSQDISRRNQLLFTPSFPAPSAFRATVQQYSSLQPYPPGSMSVTETDGPINLSSNREIHGVAPSLRERLAYSAAHNEQFYQSAQAMLHKHAYLHSKPAQYPFMPPHAILSPRAAISATFGTDPAPSTTQLHHLPGYPQSQPTFMGPITTSNSIATNANGSLITENEVLDLSDSTRPTHQQLLPSQPAASSSSIPPPEDYSHTAHSVASEAHASSRSPSPAPTPLNRPIVQPAHSQTIPGVLLSSPPPGARPASAFVHTKKLIPKRVLIEAKRRMAQADAGQAKKRDRPPQFGEDDINIFEVRFYESPERSRFCNDNNEFVVPKVPDERGGQDELRDALGRLFEKSNLPKVPSALLYNVHALAYYPFMQHLFHLYLAKGINIYDFKFGAYGQAFENPRLRELGETEFNNRLDSMCYVGNDNLLHCLVMRHIDNGARKEVGLLFLPRPNAGSDRHGAPHFHTHL
ncbi:hypothetical protein ElyMa_001056500 [Elysia marginata]|uniref:Kinase n=1 Tax=Elysia marginata TaxID=1093978 RepID=A0AAV4HPL2_9GAST|nr:hypothetical protein ElyMa_001056500 [Elysia marginata]